MENQFFWSKEKEEELKELWPKKSLSRLATHFNTTIEVIKNKVEELNLPKHNTSNWTKEEEQLLIQLSKKCYILDICKVLNRTEDAVFSKARRLGLDYITLIRKYTQEELDYIKENWGVISITQMAKTLKVSRIMLQKQANLMNLQKTGIYCKWTDEKVKKLRELAQTLNISELAKYFKTTNIAITTIASHNNIDLIDGKVSWSEEDNMLLKEYAKTMNLQEIAIKMNKSEDSIRTYARRQGIQIQKNKKYQDKIWTEQNTEQLKQLISEGKTLFQIAEIMNKNEHTVLKWARCLNLKIPKEEYRKWTKEEIEKLIELSKTKTLDEMVVELKRDRRAIMAKAKKLSLEIENKNRWAEEEEQQLIKLVMVDKKSKKEIAQILGRSEASINLKISRLGQKMQVGKRKWIKEEEDLLTELWGYKSVEYISKKLNRTPSSIYDRVYILGLGSAINNNNELLKLSEISDIFGIDIRTVEEYWTLLGLKVKTLKTSKSKSYRCVTIDDLFDFLQHYQDIWDSRKLEKNILGKEPVWLKEKRKKDVENPLDKLEIKNRTRKLLIEVGNFYESQKILDESNIDPGFRKKFEI